MSVSLCPSAQLVVSQLKESPEAVFLLNADGTVLYENPHAKKLLFETTDQQYDRGAGDPRHSYHFTFLWTFTSPNKPCQDFFDELLQSDALTYNTNSNHHKKCFDVTDDGLHNVYDVTCKRTNGTEFPGSLRLSLVGDCPCCDEPVTYLCAYLKAKGQLGGGGGGGGGGRNHPFAKEDHSLRCILNASFDPVFSIDEEGTILICNEAAERAFGWTNEEFVGSNIKMICGGGHEAKHDDYLRRYLDTGEKKIIGSKREVPARRKDGSEFLAELGVKEMSGVDYGIDDGRSYFCAFIKDLSAEKTHQLEMKHRIDLMQGMVDSSFDPMFQINERGIIETVNNAAIALFGYRREEMIGSNISLICGGGHAKNHDSYLQFYLKTGQKKVIGRKRQVTARRKGGKEFEIELGVQEVISSTGEKLFCGFVRDLTQQQLAKKRMRKHEQASRGNFFGDENGKNDGHLDPSTTM